MVNMKYNFEISRLMICGPPFVPLLQPMSVKVGLVVETVAKLRLGVPHTRLLLSAKPLGSCVSLGQ